LGLLINNNMIEEDYQAWEAYPNLRWLFNKLELALKFGYRCGPAGVPISKKGNYIIRPIYNLYGMGIGAHKKFLDPSIHTRDMIAHKYIPPGYFWCEWLEGLHYSIDFIKLNNKWEPFSTMVGTHTTEENLVTFKEWEVVSNNFVLPEWFNEIETEKYLNIESKGNNIFEVHLRSGNDHIWNLPIGTKIIPVWEGQDYSEYSNLEFIDNLHEDSFLYSANGYLSDIRKGYYIKPI